MQLEEGPCLPLSVGVDSVARSPDATAKALALPLRGSLRPLLPEWIPRGTSFFRSLALSSQAYAMGLAGGEFGSCVCVPAAREPGGLILASTLGRHSHHVENSFAKELGDQEQEQEEGAGRNIYHVLTASKVFRIYHLP